MHLALINIAKARFALTDVGMSGFVDNLDRVNAVAERSAGFVWRLIAEGAPDATGIVAFDDPRIIVNMAVWTNIKTLRDFTYYTLHQRIFDRKSEWFERMDGPHMALWWIDKGHVPTVEEGKRKLAILADNGPSSEAFLFGAPYAPTGEALTTD